jgi:oxygen-independent coproporphyrinogen-3 oxidase
MNDGDQEGKPGLYIHVPFCKTKCPYCDFFSITDLGPVARWSEALEREMDAYGDLFSWFDSVYIGGGTPSVLDGRTISRLMDSVRDRWPLSPGAEVTLEVNPDDVTEEKLCVYRSAGINRLSVGIQSFDDGELVFLKRRHTAEGAKRALGLVQSCGFDNFGIDLMYGLKDQTRKIWLDTLEKALAFGPAHLSCYQLTLEGATPFTRLKEQGMLAPLTEEAGRRFFLDTSRFLTGRGFIHYEISNFAQGAEHMSRHNLKYWNHSPYLGLGPGAHSFLGGRRWWNYRSVERYCASLDAGLAPLEGFEALSPEQVRLERVYFGFRTREGLDAADLGPHNLASKTFGDLKRLRLVKVKGTRITPTTKGFLLADRLPLMFTD